MQRRDLFDALRTRRDAALRDIAVIEKQLAAGVSRDQAEKLRGQIRGIKRDARRDMLTLQLQAAHAAGATTTAQTLEAALRRLDENAKSAASAATFRGAPLPVARRGEGGAR
jgi:hypothetical protein